MIQLTEQEFATLREGMAAAKLLVDRLLPAIRAHRMALPKEAKWISGVATEPILTAFQLFIDAAAADDRKLTITDKPGPEQQVEFDIPMIRNELENVCALVLPDLQYEFACALAELPGLNSMSATPDKPDSREARLATTCWEAGRRYGLMEAIAVCNGTLSTARDFTQATLEATRDRSLEGDPPFDTGKDSASPTADDDHPKKQLVN
jgi:hypothetical protein